jgi:hypothetical protein
MFSMNQLTANLIRLEKAESFLTYRWPLGLRPNLETEIKQLRRQLPPQAIDRYNLLKKRGTPAIAQVVDGVCQGCGQPVPPSSLQQLEADDPAACCPTCERFLYSDTEREIPVACATSNSRWQGSGKEEGIAQ